MGIGKKALPHIANQGPLHITQIGGACPIDTSVMNILPSAKHQREILGHTPPSNTRTLGKGSQLKIRIFKRIFNNIQVRRTQM